MMENLIVICVSVIVGAFAAPTAGGTPTSR
jgi:hypothetical protein